jgi:hypothetical protein
LQETTIQTEAYSEDGSQGMEKETGGTTKKPSRKSSWWTKAIALGMYLYNLYDMLDMLNNKSNDLYVLFFF